MVARRPSRPQRPPGQVVLQHAWQWAPQPRRLPWGFLATTGPHEEAYVAGNGTLDGSAYECERCGCVRVFAWLEVTDREGEVRRESVALHGFDWESLAPMNAPSCEVWERPAVEPLDELGEGSVAA